MRLRAFGPTCRDVPAIGQGTWNAPVRGGAREEAIRALRRGIELGQTHIDTAEMYGDGASEELVGEAIRPYDRTSLFIVSKVLPSNASYDGTLRACERSLRRIGTEYLDCYLLHWRGSIPLEETLRALAKLVADGTIRSLGVSNFDVDDMRDARAILGETPIACNQLLYNLDERTIEAAEIPEARERGTAIVGYTPFGGRTRGDAIARIAEGRGVSPHAVTLAFLTREPIVFAIPKASTVAHVEANAQAADLELTAAEIAAIDAAYPARPRRGALAMG